MANVQSSVDGGRGLATQQTGGKAAHRRETSGLPPTQAECGILKAHSARWIDARCGFPVARADLRRNDTKV